MLILSPVNIRENYLFHLYDSSRLFYIIHIIKLYYYYNNNNNMCAEVVNVQCHIRSLQLSNFLAMKKTGSSCELCYSVTRQRLIGGHWPVYSTSTSARAFSVFSKVTLSRASAPMASYTALVLTMSSSESCWICSGFRSQRSRFSAQTGTAVPDTTSPGTGHKGTGQCFWCARSN